MGKNTISIKIKYGECKMQFPALREFDERVHTYTVSLWIILTGRRGQSAADK